MSEPCHYVELANLRFVSHLGWGTPHFPCVSLGNWLLITISNILCNAAHAALHNICILLFPQGLESHRGPQNLGNVYKNPAISRAGDRETSTRKLNFFTETGDSAQTGIRTVPALCKYERARS